MDWSGFYLAFHLTVTTALPIMTWLGTPMIANTVRAVASFRALPVAKYFYSIINFIKTIRAAITAVVTTTENFGARFRATEERGRDIFEAANLNCMATPSNSLFDLDVTFNDFQVLHLMAKDSFLGMATGKLHVLNLRQARATIITAQLGTFVLTG